MIFFSVSELPFWSFAFAVPAIIIVGMVGLCCSKRYLLRYACVVNWMDSGMHWGRARREDDWGGARWEELCRLRYLDSEPECRHIMATIEAALRYAQLCCYFSFHALLPRLLLFLLFSWADFYFSYVSFAAF